MKLSLLKSDTNVNFHLLEQDSHFYLQINFVVLFKSLFEILSKSLSIKMLTIYTIMQQ